MNATDNNMEVSVSLFNRTIIFSSCLWLVSLSASASYGESDRFQRNNDRVVTPETSVYTLGPTVTTSPYLGIRSAFDGRDLMVNLPSMNEDLRILLQRQELKHKLGALPCADRPIVELSGDLTGRAFYAERFNDAGSIHSIELNGVRLDTLAEVSDWAFGLISLNYDSSSLPSVLPGSGSRIKNSNVGLARGFLTVGDLDEYPVYFSLGQMFVPFGRYSSTLLSSPLTAAIGKTNARALNLGFYLDGLFGAVYGFRGDSKVGDTGINQWGVNLGYEHSGDGLHYEVGAGYIANIADSTGLQCANLSGTGFRGFAFSPVTEMLQQRVPAYDVHGSATYCDVTVRGEFVGTTRAFDANDLSYNGKGAKLNALHLEVVRRQALMEYNFNLALVYDHAWDAVALGLPKQSFSAVLNTSIWKNTIQSIEYRHDRNYSSGDTGAGIVGKNTTAMITSTGGSRNSVIGQIGIYF